MKRTWLIAGLLILTFSLPALSMAALATPTTSAPTGSAAGAAAGTSTAAPNSISDPLSTLTSVKVKDADVREVLATVFRAVGVDFLLTDEVSGKISMIRQNAPARTILEIICAGQGLHWWKKGDTYVVSARPDSAPAESASAAVPQPLPAGAKKWRSYAVQHQHPRDLASCFNPQQEPTTEGRMWRMSLTGVFADSLARGQDPGQHNREFVDTSLKPFDSGASRLGESAQFPGYSGSAFGPGFGPGYGAPQAQGVTPNAGTTGLPLTPEEEEMLRSGINIGAPFAALLPPGMTAPVAYEPLNYLIFEATDEAYDRFLELVRIFDQKPKQVILEVQFITMSTSDAFSLGLDWFWNVGQTALNVAGMAPGGNVTLRVAKGQQFGAVLSTLLTTGRARLVNAPASAA